MYQIGENQIAKTTTLIFIGTIIITTLISTDINEITQKSNKMGQKLENKEKLNWLEKKAIKKFLKHAQKKVQKFKQEVQQEYIERDKLEQEVLSMLEVLDITTDEGETLNEKNIKKQSNIKLVEILEEALTEMEKLL